MFLAFFVLVFVLGEDFIFVWLELVELFRLYLGASLCIFSFSSCHIIFVRLYMLGGVYFVVLVSNFILIYDYEFFIIMSLLFVFEIKIFIFLYLYFFPHMRLCILFKCFRKYTG